MRYRVAMLSAACMQADEPSRRDDHWEHELQWSALQPACAAQGIDLRTVIWDRTDWSPRDFDAIVVGTTWDYMERPDEFMARLKQIANQSPLCNALATIRWNTNKTYLRELQSLGAPVVPTLWAESASEAHIRPAFEHFACEEIVIKPTIGAGAWRQVRLRMDQPWPQADLLPPAQCMVQPFLPSIATEGEYSLLYFGGQFSHCAQKRPKAGDYRVQAMYGATERAYNPSPEELELAQSVLTAAAETTGATPLYARVDMVRGLRGNLELIELELIEPYLYPEQGPELGAHFAKALWTQLQGQ